MRREPIKIKKKQMHGDIDGKDGARAQRHEGHSLKIVWCRYTAGRELSHPIPPRIATIHISHLFYICTQRHSIYKTVLSGFLAFLLAQVTPLGGSMCRSSQSGSKTSQACYSHPRCNLNVVRLFRFSLPLPVFGRPFLSPPPRSPSLYLQPPSHTVLCQTPGSSAAVLQSPVMPNSRRSSATQSVHYFFFPPGSRSPALPT